MATIKNDRDILLQATSPRLNRSSSNSIVLSATTTSIKESAAGLYPTSSIIIARLVGELKGSIAWTTSPAITTSVDSSTTVLTIAGADIPYTGVLVTATLTYLGLDYSSSITLVKNQESVVAQLTKDTLTIATNTDGSAGDYTNATSSMSVIIGNAVDTSNWAFSWSIPVGVTTNVASRTTNTIIVTDMSADSAALVCTATKAGWPTQTKTFNLVKTKKGAGGQIVYIAASTVALTKSTSSTYTPATVSFYAYSKLGDAAPGTYSGIFKIYENGSTTASYTSATAQTSTTYTPTASCTSIKTELYDSTGTSLVDSLGVAVAEAGSSSLQAILSNDNHTLSADSSGNVTSYVGSGTAIYVYEGASLIPYDGVGTSNSTWKVTAAVTTGTVTVGSITSSTSYATVAAHSALTTDSAVITYTITGKSSKGVAFSFTQTQKLSKSKQGIAGSTPDTSTYLTTYGSYILSGTQTLQTSGGLKVGTIAWDSNGNLTGGSGVAITAKGLVGASGGTPTFTLTDTGNAIFKGDVRTGGDGVFEGLNTTTITQVINNGTYSVDYSVYGKADTAPAANRMRTGIFGTSAGSTGTTSWGVGVMGTGASTSNGIGILGSGGAIGGWFENKTTNFAAVYAINQQYTGGNATAIIANGIISATHDIIAYNTSDRRLKTDISRIRSPLYKINKLSGVNFTWKDSHLQQVNSCVGQTVFVPKHDVGVIAQEVQQVMPAAVRVREDGTLSVNYEKLVPLLIEGIKELQKKVSSLEKRVKHDSTKH